MHPGEVSLRTLVGILLAAALIAGAGSSAVADVAVSSPPQNLEASNEEGTVVLDWDPPSVNADAVEEYRVYENGVVVDTTEQTWSELDEADLGDVYWVTAVTQTSESAPSNSALAGPCTEIDPEHVPPVYVDPQCDPVLYSL